MNLSHLPESHCISRGWAGTLWNAATGDVGGDTWNDTTIRVRSWISLCSLMTVPFGLQSMMYFSENFLSLQLLPLQKKPRRGTASSSVTAHISHSISTSHGVPDSHSHSAHQTMRGGQHQLGWLSLPPQAPAEMEARPFHWHWAPNP